MQPNRHCQVGLVAKLVLATTPASPEQTGQTWSTYWARLVQHPGPLERETKSGCLNHVQTRRVAQPDKWISPPPRSINHRFLNPRSATSPRSQPSLCRTRPSSCQLRTKVSRRGSPRWEKKKVALPSWQYMLFYSCVGWEHPGFSFAQVANCLAKSGEGTGEVSGGRPSLFEQLTADEKAAESETRASAIQLSWPVFVG